MKKNFDWVYGTRNECFGCSRSSGNINHFLNGQSTEQPEQLLFLLSQQALFFPFRRK